MKKFLLKVALFLILFVATFALPIVFETAVSSRVSLELPKDKTILFVGDSHIENGVDDKLIPGAFNWAKGGENYLNLFVRTRKLLEANPQIRTVFISTTPRSLGENTDWRMFTGDASVLLELNIIFYGKEELEDCWETLVSTLKNPRPQRIALLKAISSKTFETIEEFGCFDSSDKSRLLEDLENDAKLAKARLLRDDTDGNALTIKYLRKIVELVRARGGRIIFLNTPIYHAEDFFDVPHYENLLKEKFSDVEFWDYADFPIPENCFYNVNHLNGRGAEIFSKELARRMKEEGIIGD